MCLTFTYLKDVPLSIYAFKLDVAFAYLQSFYRVVGSSLFGILTFNWTAVVNFSFDRKEV